MDTGNAHVAALEFVAQSLRESTHRKFAGRVGRLSRRSDDPEYARKGHDVRSLFTVQYRHKVTWAVHRAPEIDVHQPTKIIQGDFREIALQQNAYVSDETR